MHPDEITNWDAFLCAERNGLLFSQQGESRIVVN